MSRICLTFGYYNQYVLFGDEYYGFFGNDTIGNRKTTKQGRRKCKWTSI